MRSSRRIAIKRLDAQCRRTDRVLVWYLQSGAGPHRAQRLWAQISPVRRSRSPSNVHFLVTGLARFRSRPPPFSKAHATLATLVVATALLPGCASIVKGSSQSINITTPPATGATCTLSSKEGSWSLISPGSVTVDKSKDDMQVHCTKPGWQDGSGIIPSNFQGWTLGNILLGGVIGLGVDAATGALNEYPNAFQVPMMPQGPPIAPPPAVAPPAALPQPTNKSPGA